VAAPITELDVHNFFILISLKVEIKKVGDIIILETGTGD
jgi:hypothetical protein